MKSGLRPQTSGSACVSPEPDVTYEKGEVLEKLRVTARGICEVPRE